MGSGRFRLLTREWRLTNQVVEPKLKRSSLPIGGEPIEVSAAEPA